MRVLSHEENVETHRRVVVGVLSDLEKADERFKGTYMRLPTVSELIETEVKKLTWISRKLDDRQFGLLRCLLGMNASGAGESLKEANEEYKALSKDLKEVFFSTARLFLYAHANNGMYDAVPKAYVRLADKLVDLFDDRGKAYGSSYQDSRFPWVGVVQVLRYRIARILTEYGEGKEVDYESADNNLVDVMNYSVMASAELERQFNGGIFSLMEAVDV